MKLQLETLDFEVFLTKLSRKMIKDKCDWVHKYWMPYEVLRDMGYDIAKTGDDSEHYLNYRIMSDDAQTEYAKIYKFMKDHKIIVCSNRNGDILAKEFRKR